MGGVIFGRTTRIMRSFSPTRQGLTVVLPHPMIFPMLIFTFQFTRSARLWLGKPRLERGMNPQLKKSRSPLLGNAKDQS